jgi:hypothetical protein
LRSRYTPTSSGSPPTPSRRTTPATGQHHEAPASGPRRNGLLSVISSWTQNVTPGGFGTSAGARCRDQ